MLIFRPSPVKKTSELPVVLTPQGSIHDMDPTSDLSSFNYLWKEVEQKDIVTNKNVISWVSDLRNCSTGDKKALSACLEKQSDKFRVGDISLPGREWVTSYKITSAGSSNYNELLKSFLKIDPTWTLNYFDINKNQKFMPLQAAQSATYQPTCVYAFFGNSIRVACLTMIIDKSYTTGEGMMLEYKYPVTEEVRFFLSDLIPFDYIKQEINK